MDFRRIVFGKILVECGNRLLKYDADDVMCHVHEHCIDLINEIQNIKNESM